MKKCLYCYNDIHEQAKKCQYCHEWQENEEEVILQKIKNPKGIKLETPFQLSLLSFTKMPYYVTTLIITAIFFSAFQAIFIINDEKQVYLLTMLTYCLQFYSTWIGLIWVYKEVEKQSPEINGIIALHKDNNEKKGNYEILLKTLFAPQSILIGIVVGLSASIGEVILGTPFNKESTKLAFAAFEFINMFFAGAAIFGMVRFGYFVSQVTNLEKSLSKIDPSDIRQFYNLGTLHLKTSLIAIIPLFLGVVARLFGDWSWDVIFVVWYSGFAVLILVYLFLPMIHIHGIMFLFKNRQSDIIAYKIQNLQKSIEEEPSHRNLQRLYQLRQVEKDVGGLKTWPFSTKNLSAVFFAIIVPIIMLFIDKFLK